MFNSYIKLSVCCIILFLCATTVKAQQYFSRLIDEQTIPIEERVSAGLKATYSETHYARETSFMPTQNFTLQLPDRSTIQIYSLRWYEMTNGSIAYTGKIEGQEQSDVTFAMHIDRWFGMIVNEHGKKYIFHQTADDVFAISTINEASLIAKEGNSQDLIVANDQDAVPVYNICAVDNPCDADNVTINLMVVYTTAVISRYVNENALIAAIATAVANMTLANQNSGVRAGITFNLAHATSVVYTDTGDTGLDLGRLQATNDGYLDDVHTLRDTYAADLVSLIVDQDDFGCGIGYLNVSTTNYTATAGFNVTLYSCMVGNYTMAHEFGHNMGLQHDYYVSNDTRPCAHHHGYVNQAAFAVGAPAAKRWRTILAYNNECQSRGGFNCSRLNYWSNPNITNTSDPMGIPIGNPKPAYEAYAIDRFACQVASFRGNSVLPLNFIYANASIQQERIVVNWKTENESRVDYFEIEVATELPRNFTSVGQLDAKNEVVNLYNQNIFLPTAKHIFIRIKSVGDNGDVKYSSIIHLSNENHDFARLLTNLVQTQLDLIINQEEESNTLIEIVDMKGMLIKNSKQLLPGNTTAHNIQVGHLQSGHYILRLTNNKQRQTIRFFKQ